MFYSNVDTNNYCLFQLLPIGSKCLLTSSIKPYNLSCRINLNYSNNSDLQKINNEHMFIMNKRSLPEQKPRFKHNIISFLITIITFTMVLLLTLIGNFIYIEHSRNTTPHYLKYYRKSSDMLNK